MEGSKDCPRCEGAVFVGWDYTDGGWYEYCLQCSYRNYLPAVVESKPAVSTGTKRKRRKKRGKSNDKGTKI